VNLQEVAGGKKFLELLLEAVNFTGYRLIRRTLGKEEVILGRSLEVTTILVHEKWQEGQGKLKTSRKIVAYHHN